MGFHFTQLLFAAYPTGIDDLRREFISGFVTTPAFLRAASDGVLLSIKLQPRACVDEIGEPLGSELRVRVTAPPVDAAANEALVRFLAKQLGCPRNRVELVRGHASRHKLIKLHGLTVEQVTDKLPA